MRASVFTILVLLISVMASCSGGDTAESVSKEIVANLKEMGVILTGVTDEASAKAAVPKIEALREKMRDAAKRAKSVPKIDAATEEKIGASMQAGMQEAMTSIATAQQRLMSQPELMAIIEPALQNMENDM